jgi:tetratricopeptide (TPR) repeat protein
MPSLDPVAPPRGVSPLDTPSARPNALSLDATGAARKSAQTTASMANIDAQHQRARAATVMQASGGSASTFISYLRGSPVALLGAVAVLFGVAFGVYVYLQIAQPGLFVRQAANRPQESPMPPATSANPAPPQPLASSTDAAVAPTQALASSPTPEPGTGSAANPAVALSSAAVTSVPSTGALGPAVTADRPAPSSGAGAQISAAAVIGPRAAEPFRDPGMERAADLPRERGSIRPVAENQKPQPAAAPAAEAPLAARERIAVSPAAAQARLNPILGQAYAALQSGKFVDARSLYTKVNEAEPLNVDALLGLAYIAAQENRSDDAVAQYMRILSVNPRHAAAQGALIGLMGRADPVASETRLKQLISREPSPFLHFVLGNLYADQGLWSQAQQAYFQAHNLEPDNPDYAYNLAVGLDHLRQSKLALNFYRRSEQLASSLGRSNFNLSHARERIATLSSQLD